METAVKNGQHTIPVISAPKPITVSAERPIPKGIGSLWYRITHWETWDWRVKYLVIGPAWLWYCLRSRSPWFFTASNPTLTFGGFDGESKKEIYDQLPVEHIPKYRLVPYKISFQEVKNIMRSGALSYPVAVKPDVGKMGLMFRKITCDQELQAYHQRIGCDYLIQEWIDHRLEVSVFYYRFPTQRKGHITGFVRKDFLEVCGDGRSSLEELIMKYPRVRFRQEEMLRKHAHKLHLILARGEKYCLSPALNLSRGGKLTSLEHEKDENLLKVFDRLSHQTKTFFYGRYDIKCKSIDDLKRGLNYSIIEFNGSGAEPHHVYGNNLSLWKACRTLVAHWQILYKISRVNHRAGIPYWSFWRGWKFMKDTARHLQRLRKLDLDTQLN